MDLAAERTARQYSELIVNDHRRPAGDRLTGENPAIFDFVGGQRVIHPHRCFTLVEVCHTRCAITGLTRKGRAQAAAPSRFQDCVTGSVVDCVFAPFDADHEDRGDLRSRAARCHAERLFSNNEIGPFAK